LVQRLIDFVNRTDKFWTREINRSAIVRIRTESKIAEGTLKAIFRTIEEENLATHADSEIREIVRELLALKGNRELRKRGESANAVAEPQSDQRFLRTVYRRTALVIRGNEAGLNTVANAVCNFLALHDIRFFQCFESEMQDCLSAERVDWVLGVSSPTENYSLADMLIQEADLNIRVARRAEYQLLDPEFPISESLSYLREGSRIKPKEGSSLCLASYAKSSSSNYEWLLIHCLLVEGQRFSKDGLDALLKEVILGTRAVSKGQQFVAQAL
jgi:hypothetical protein